jgi:carboxymethylenebutenolidase
VLYINLY